MEQPRWKTVIQHCSGQIDSLVELLQGKFSRGVMEVITCQQRGLFPGPKQLSMDCSCPDGAVMCKHVAAVLYGVGARLDEKPELFFQLRNVDHSELITAAGTATTVTRTGKTDKVLKSKDLSNLFGIELEAEAQPQSPVQTDSTVKVTKQFRSGSTKNSEIKRTSPKKKKSRRR